jgi:hypothetical protein
MNISAGLNVLMRLAIKEHDLLFGSVEYSKLPLNRSQQQMEALDNFVAAVSKIEDEPITDEDFTTLENKRLTFRRGIGV